MNRNKPIKVVLADDHQMFVDGVHSFLKTYSDIEVVGTVNNGKEVLDILEEQPVDIVILDIDMPKLNGIETCKAIKKNYPSTKVLIASMYNTKEFVTKLLENGAAGYILKERTKEDLVTAINNIRYGKAYFGLKVMDMATAPKPPIEEKVDLSEREVEIMCHLAKGNSAVETAKLLNLSQHTINTHRRNILTKTGLNNVTKLALYAVRHGYIQP